MQNVVGSYGNIKIRKDQNVVKWLWCDPVVVETENWHLKSDTKI